MKIRKIINSATLLLISFSLATGSSYGAANQFPIMGEPGSTITVENNKFIKETYNELDTPSIHIYSRTATLNYNLSREKEENLVRLIKEEAKKYPKYSIDNLKAPNVKEGMVGLYDGMGYLTKVVDKDGNIIPFTATVTKLSNGQVRAASYYNQNGTWSWPSKTNANTLTRTDQHVLAEGWITWYDGVGKIGNHDNVLKNDDCATKMDYDRPSSNQKINVRNLDNDKTSVVYKNDVGGLPNAVLDIMPDKMKDDFGVSVDKKNNSGRFNGRYFYNR